MQKSHKMCLIIYNPSIGVAKTGISKTLIRPSSSFFLTEKVDWQAEGFILGDDADADFEC